VSSDTKLAAQTDAEEVADEPRGSRLRTGQVAQGSAGNRPMTIDVEIQPQMGTGFLKVTSTSAKPLQDLNWRQVRAERWGSNFLWGL